MEGTGKKLIEEGGDPELSLLCWLFRRKNVMPWEVYAQPKGYRDLVFAMASLESELLSKK